MVDAEKEASSSTKSKVNRGEDAAEEFDVDRRMDDGRLRLLLLTLLLLLSPDDDDCDGAD